MSAPLYGKNLVRLLYLDEAGSDFKAPSLVVAGVLVHGDIQWPRVNRRIEMLVEKYVEPEHQLGFVFHAKDIFHGSGYFNRDNPKWSREKRIEVINDLAKIIKDLELPVLAGGYQKQKFGLGSIDFSIEQEQQKGILIQNVAALDCLIWADRWLARFSPSELATVIHEDGTKAKKFIKHSVLIARSGDLLSQWGADDTTLREVGLPLKRIIDTVHFAEKADARPLQLADLCAFVLGRAAKDHAVPAEAFHSIWGNLKWVSNYGSLTTGVTPTLAEAVSRGGLG